MKTVLTVAVTVAATVVLVGAAVAFMGPGHGPGGMGRGMMMQVGPHMMAQGARPMGPSMHRSASPRTNLELRLRGAALVGERRTEYGEKQNDYRLELRVRYYF